jgi:protein arginine N-methyltransferase 1
MYSVYGYGEMIADQVRMDAYVSALRNAITPDSVVLDIGTGPGVFAVLACKFGAKRVYAIEPADAIQLAREFSAANGCSEQIVFFQDLSTRVSLPERADVIISDLRGVLPLFQQHVGSIIDARRRFLASGGALIPQRDSLWAAVVSAPKTYADYVRPWSGNGYGLDLRPAEQLVLNTWAKKRVTSDQLLVEPKCWATLDYTTIESSDIHAELSWIVTRAGAADGLSVWFDAVLAEGVGFSNGPDAPELIYGNAFFPLQEPVNLGAGDHVAASIDADLVGDDYVWRWETKVTRPSQTPRLIANFKQSTFLGAPRSLSQLRKRAGTYLPRLNDDGEIDSFVLANMNGSTSSEEIARQVATRYPNRFVTINEALNRVGELAQEYSV